MTAPNNQPFVSIVIPTYKREHLLRETILSILQQTYKQFEIIIVADYVQENIDFSKEPYTDDCIQIIELKEKTVGPAAVRNIGIKASTGEWIAFCDDDDLWHPEKLSRQVSAVKKIPDLQIIATNSNFMGIQGDVRMRSGAIKNLINRLNLLPIKYRICIYNCITLSSSMVHKTVFEKFGLFNETEELYGHEDFEFWLRVCNYCSFKIIPDKLVTYRLHKRNESLSANEHYKASSLHILQANMQSFSPMQRLLIFIRVVLFKMLKF